MTAPLPVSVSPAPGEAIDSWLERLADANHLTTAALSNLIRREVGVAGSRYLTLAPQPQATTALAQLARVPETAIVATTMQRLDGIAVDLSGLDPEIPTSYRQIAARGWAPGRGTQLCPHCLTEHDGAWQSTWRLPIVAVCGRHRCHLVATCPTCRRPFRDKRQGYLRPAGSEPLCGNALGNGPRQQCGQPIAAIATTPADSATLATQNRIDAALRGEQVPVLGEPAEPTAYLTDLRHLTTLLLHLAAHAEDAQPAAWVDLLTAAREARIGEREPRWGISPPDDPALRATAITTADQILTCTSAEHAAQSLMIWTELTPTVPEGPLGWLADHTVMTPTLTRLVIATQAPHRRLAYQLDRLAPSGLDPALIPTMLPLDLYERYCVGAFACTARTVRTFASLCLSRMAHPASSWSQAATTLGMHGETGRKAAVAASARMLVPSAIWLSRLRQVDGVIRRARDCPQGPQPQRPQP